MTSRSPLLLLLSMSLAACSSTLDADEGSEHDLFACEIQVDCVQDSGHLGETLTEEAVRCGGELAASGEPGALLSASQPGPNPTQIQSLVVLLGDGTAYKQSRSRCAAQAEGQSCGIDEDENVTEWERTALERCTITVAPEDIAGCGTDGTCAWFGQTADCAVVDADWTCGALLR
jgi:hypothetical protein